ncbi:transposable element Tcb1 transposase [Trichonephila clavipes]|nr:transposable element Tcb1 transposase [Trichonephila clavipes]
MARIVRHNDQSVREGYIRNGGKEVKLFTSTLKAFQCNNRIFMEERKHLDDFLRGRIIERLECGRTQLDDGNVSRCYSTRHLRVTKPNEDRYSAVTAKKNRRSTSSDLSCQLSSATGTTVSRQTVYRHLGHIGLYARRPVRCVPVTETNSHLRLTWRWLVWGGIILGSITNLHVQSVMMTSHIYRNAILEQHVHLFRDAMVAEFMFMDDYARPHHANIVDECLQSEDITRMD